MPVADLSVSFPSPGLIRLQSRSLFGDAENPTCRRFFGRMLQAEEITGITIRGGDSPRAELRFCPGRYRRDEVVARIIALLRNGTDRPTPPRDRHRSARSNRDGTLGTGWKITLDQPARLRLKHSVLYRRSELCRAIERELRSTLGIDQYRASSFTGAVQVDYDPAQLDRSQVIAILDGALNGDEDPPRLDRLDLHLPVCTASLPIAAAAQFAAPALLPLAAGILAYTSIHTLRKAGNVLVKQRRLGADVLDAVVLVGCLGTMSIFPGAVLCWCLGVGRVLVKRTQDHSRKMVLDAFGKQPRSAWLYRDGDEVEVPLNRIRKGDLVVVNPGEVVPVDGHIVEGMAMIDSHPVTGESTPAEKGVGDRVFASTLMIGGKAYVSVESAGSETASATIGRILDETADHKLSSQNRAERLADRAVLPALSLGAVGLATMGPGSALALLHRDLGAGIRMAAPLAMLSALALCAHQGILVKDGRALERMNEIDTILFDRNAMLTRERPEAGRVISSAGFTPDQILRLAAAAEWKFHHPIARAIRQRARQLHLRPPAAVDARYKVGFGIAARVQGCAIRVGSRPFLESEGIALPPEFSDPREEARRDGLTLVMVAVDDRLGGAIELRSAIRPELPDVMRGLRRRGIDCISIIAGDHEGPTRTLAESLGVDRSFAQILPADKADYVETLRAEGRKVCFVGDGIDDAIAMERADVSISLRGASTIAADAAHVVFLDGSPAKLGDLRDIARELARNVARSRSLILAPNLACVAGVFTMGFGIMASVLTNNIAALAALGNGVLPLRKVAQLEAESRHRLEIYRAVAAGMAPDGPIDERPRLGPRAEPAELASSAAAVYDGDGWNVGGVASRAGGPDPSMFTSY
jgi:Cu2+-exporting ATPase